MGECKHDCLDDGLHQSTKHGIRIDAWLNRVGAEGMGEWIDEETMIEK